MGPTGCPETSVRNYHFSLCNNAEKRFSQTNQSCLLHNCAPCCECLWGSGGIPLRIFTSALFGIGDYCIASRSDCSTPRKRRFVIVDARLFLSLKLSGYCGKVKNIYQESEPRLSGRPFRILHSFGRAIAASPPKGQTTT